jgi:hypothetical protein
MAAENVRHARVTGPANTPTPLSQERRLAVSAVVTALDANTDKVAVGGIDAIDNTAGGQNTPLLNPGDSLPLGAVDLADVRILPRVAGEGVVVLWEE